MRLKGQIDTFTMLNLVFMFFFTLMMIYPFIYLFNISVSMDGTVISNMTLIPKGFSLDSYQTILGFKFIKTGFYNSILRVVLGTTFTFMACTLTAYALSKKALPFRTPLTMLMVFTMFFSGGLIPSYILIKDLGLIDSIWSLVLPTLIPTFSMLIMRNYFMSIPIDLEESAKIDGAGDWRTLFQVIIPISKPIIATIVLWEMVYHWNSWFDAMIYIRTAENQVLQLVMRNIVISGQLNDNTFITSAVTPEKLKAATIMIATLPIVCVYPFLQKYFIKGIIVGSLKG